eukprot:13947674-Ditylum_brightwellii.AAC.1
MHKAVLPDVSVIDFEIYKEGATYVPVPVAVALMKENCDEQIEVIMDISNDDGEEKIKAKKNW